MKYIKKVKFWFAVFSMFSFLAIGANLNHVCAYSNESVVKFREKAVQVCLLNSTIGKSKILFNWPIDLCQFWVSSLFGPRTHRGVTKFHGGVDLAALKGVPVKASAAGIIKIATSEAPGYGTLVEIQHKGGFVTRYAHLQDYFINAGDAVAAGEVIGTVGSTGNVRGKDPSHLHFEIIKDGKRVDPLSYLYCSEIAFAKQ